MCIENHLVTNVYVQLYTFIYTYMLCIYPMAEAVRQSKQTARRDTRDHFSRIHLIVTLKQVAETIAGARRNSGSISCIASIEAWKLFNDLDMRTIRAASCKQGLFQSQVEYLHAGPIQSIKLTRTLLSTLYTSIHQLWFIDH